MTKNEALQTFFASFGLKAYPVGSEPNDIVYPWLTYENVIGNAGDDAVAITVTLWYHTASEKIPNAKAEQIAERIGVGGCTIPYDGGLIWLKRGMPWATAISDQNDSAVKGRMLNIIAEFI